MLWKRAHLAFVDQARQGRRERNVLRTGATEDAASRRSTDARLEVEAAYAKLIESHVMGELVSHGARHLIAQ
jgi:hypothetical protein